MKMGYHPTRRGFLEAASISVSRLWFVSELGFGGSRLAPSGQAGEPERSAARSALVDTHMHVWADDTEQFPFSYPNQPDFKPPPVAGTLEVLLEEMDRFEIDYAVLVQAIYHGWDNGYVAQCLKSHPSRFRVQGLIDPTASDRAQKLEYWMREHRLSGMRFSPIYYQGREEWLNASDSFPLWEKAQELGAIFNFFISTPQLKRLEEMVQRFQGVRVVIDHLARVDLAAPDPKAEFDKLLKLAAYPNVWAKVTELQIISASKQYPFRDTFPWVRRMYDAFGPGRLLWGTGFPGSTRTQADRLTLEQELDLIGKHMSFFTKSDREKIMGRNANELWGFEDG